ncbi:MAG: hypothetical protein CMJ89_06165 [Planctomycetes bacterium]|nr:hypothetical protein [Planctomycetota bacterium]
MDTLFPTRVGLVAGVILSGCSESVQTSGSGPFDARSYRTIRVAHLDDSKLDWVEVPEADPEDGGRFREVELSTFGTEELLSGATAAMRTIASRILFDEMKGIGHFFADGFQGPSLDGRSSTLERTAFLNGFREYLSGFDRIRDLGFKELSVERAEGDDVHLRLEVKLSVLGRSGSAMRHAVLRFPAVVAPVEGYWRFLRWGNVSIDDRRGSEIHFLERTKEVGLRAHFEDRVRIPGENIAALLYVNGGLVLTDTDGDGDLDIYVTRLGANFHFKNDGKGRFDNVAKEDGSADEGHGHGALFVELDGDGDLDLVVANNALMTPEFPTTVLWNEGERFEADGGLGDVSGYGTAVAGADYDNDGDLDVFVGRYGDAAQEHSYSTARNAPPDLLFQNDGERRLRDAAAAAGIHNTGWTLAATFGDYDVDGDQDLYISNDFGINELYKNRGDGTFEEVAHLLGAADLGNGMGANWVDHDRDGDFDLYSVNMYSTAGKRVLEAQLEQLSGETIDGLKKMAGGNTMLRNDGGTFVDVSADVGCRDAGWAWGTEFFDYDSDGDLDMLIANGYWSSKRRRDL